MKFWNWSKDRQLKEDLDEVEKGDPAVVEIRRLKENNVRLLLRNGQLIPENKNLKQKLEKIKELIKTTEEGIKQPLSQMDEWARTLDDFMNEIKEIIDK